MTEQPHRPDPTDATPDDDGVPLDEHHREDLLDEAIEESFPASDPPAAPRFD